MHETSSASEGFLAEVYWGILCAPAVREVAEVVSVC